jgi:tellurite resistance protein
MAVNNANKNVIKSNNCFMYLPISIFAIVMGLTGLSLAWHNAYEIFAVTALIGEILRALASLIFVFLFIMYTLKVTLYPQAVRDELAHPIRSSFFATLSVSILLLATAWLPDIPHLSFILWSIGTILHLIISLRIMNSWMYQTHYEIKHVNPAWFIPIVGNIIVPIVGVKIMQIELSWFFFSIGIVFWLILFTIILNRIFLYEPLPIRLMPTLFILLAPPSVGAVAWIGLVGKFDTFAHILYYTALFLFLLLISNASSFLRIPFYISAWAFSFPLAAFTIATLQIAKLSGMLIFTWLGYVLLFLVSIVIIVLFIRTLIAAWRREICLPE